MASHVCSSSTIFSRLIANPRNFGARYSRLFLPIYRSIHSPCGLLVRSSLPRFQTYTPYTRSTHSSSDLPPGSLPSPPAPILRFSPPRPKRIVVGVTGATGGVLAIRLLQTLKELGIETHLIMSKWAVATLKYETDITADEIRALATANYAINNMAAPPASGSFLHDVQAKKSGSMKTLAAVRIGFGDDLIARSADVCLKEGRKLLLVVRETPLSDVHLENMLFLRRAGAVIFPPVPAFYIRPKCINDLVNQTVGRILDSMGIHTEGFERWAGFQKR